MPYLQNIEYEIKIYIFNSHLNLTLTCRSWSVIVKDPYAKTEWLITHYGKVHALFHALRLSPTFINITICQTLHARNVVTSRYFILGKYDQSLKIEQLDADRIRAFRQLLCWASNLSITIFIYLLDEGHNKSSNTNEVLSSNRNYVASFYFIIASNHVINYVIEIPRKNLKDIKYLTLNNRFTPFQQSKPKYTFKNGYENDKLYLGSSLSFFTNVGIRRSRRIQDQIRQNQSVGLNQTGIQNQSTQNQPRAQTQPGRRGRPGAQNNQNQSRVQNQPGRRRRRAHNQRNQPRTQNRRRRLRAQNQQNQPPGAHNQQNQPPGAQNQQNQPVAQNQRNQPPGAQNQQNQPVAQNQRNQPLGAQNQQNQPGAQNQQNQPPGAQNQQNQPVVQNQQNQPGVQPGGRQINTQGTLNLITNLPQQRPNDPLVNDFFNGSQFN